MNFACLTTIAPGRTLAEQCEAIAAAGCAGVETIVFPETPLVPWVQRMKQATGDQGLQTAVVILGGLALYEIGQSGWIEEALQAAAELNAAALITPEYRAQDPLPLFPPFPAPSPIEETAVVDAVGEIVQAAAQLGVTLLLEPVTQFEGRFWRTAADVLPLIHSHSALDKGEQIGLALDFHNMNITEADPLATIVGASSSIKHIHLADNNRLLPGAGHIDFAAGLGALQAVSYTGWYSFECAVPHDFVAQVCTAISWLRGLNTA